jgi:hypothetical protein
MTPDTQLATIDSGKFTRLSTINLPTVALLEHPQHLDMPLDPEAFQALCADVQTNGITNRLIVTKLEPGAYHVLAGNQRLKAAKAIGLREVPVEVIATDDPICVMLADNVLGRTRTKSAIALQVFLYYREELVSGEAGEAKKALNLKKGSSPMANHSPSGNIGDSARSLALKYGFDHQLLNDLVEIWRMCHEGGDLKASMAIWGKAVASIASGEVSTSRIKAGMAGRVSTLGKKRGEPDWGDLVRTSTVTLGNAWKNWEAIPDDDRTDFNKAFKASMEHIPDDGIDIISKSLSKWSNSQIKAISKAAANEIETRRTKQQEQEES